MVCKCTVYSTWMWSRHLNSVIVPRESPHCAALTDEIDIPDSCASLGKKKKSKSCITKLLSQFKVRLAKLGRTVVVMQRAVCVPRWGGKPWEIVCHFVYAVSKVFFFLLVEPVKSVLITHNCQIGVIAAVVPVNCEWVRKQILYKGNVFLVANPKCCSSARRWVTTDTSVLCVDDRKPSTSSSRHADRNASCPFLENQNAASFVFWRGSILMAWTDKFLSVKGHLSKTRLE